MRSFVGGLLVGMCLAGAPAWGAPEAAKPNAPAPAVRYRNDKVTLDVHEVGLDAVLKAIARESGAELVGAVRTERTITIALDDVPIKEALERLVGAQNFTLKYDDGGKLKAIEMRGGQEAAEKPKPTVDVPPEGDSTPPKEYAFWHAFDRADRTIPISGELRQRIGRDAAGWDYVANTAIGDQDPRIRLAAMRALMRALDADPETRDRAVASLSAMTDAELAAFARKTAHYRAEDLVRNVLREMPDRELRYRAREVLRELRKAPWKGPRFQLH